MNPGFSYALRDAGGSLRLFITAFLILLTCGYAVGLFFVDHTTGGTVAGLSEEYRGSPEGADSPELKYAKTADEMYILLHNHMLSLSLVFFAVGGLFHFSSLVSPRLKSFLTVEPLVAVGTTFGGIWLTRFVSDSFGILVVASGISMAGCYFAMVGLILWELWTKK